MARKQPTELSFRIASLQEEIAGRLRMVRPIDDARPAPAVLLLPGEAVSSTDVPPLADSLADGLLDAGLTVAEYSPPAPSPENAAESAIEAAVSVLDWLRGQQTIDARRIGVLGHSIAAVLAACAAGRSSDVARLCLIAPIAAELAARRVERDKNLQAALQAAGIDDGVLKSFAACAPLQAVVAHDRPTMLIHGAADHLIPPEQSLAYVAALEYTNHRVDFVQIAFGDHHFTDEDCRKACVSQVAQFFAPLLEED